MSLLLIASALEIGVQSVLGSSISTGVAAGIAKDASTAIALYMITCISCISWQKNKKTTTDTTDTKLTTKEFLDKPDIILCVSEWNSIHSSSISTYL